MVTFILVMWKHMLKTKLIGLRPEIFAENTAWIWSQLKLHLRMISSKNSSKAVRHDFFWPSHIQFLKMNVVPLVKSTMEMRSI